MKSRIDFNCDLLFVVSGLHCQLLVSAMFNFVIMCSFSVMYNQRRERQTYYLSGQRSGRDGITKKREFSCDRIFPLRAVLCVYNP